VQVADRFHLWQDLAEAVEKTVLACLAASAPQPGPQTPQTAAPQDGPPPTPRAPAQPDGFRDQHGRERRLVARHRERYVAVQALRAQGCTIRQIARRLGLARNTVLKFAQAASIDELLVKATTRPSILDPFKPYLSQRWNQGITSAAALHEEIRAHGWEGGILTVERYLRQFRTADGRDRQARARPQLTAPSAPAPPKPRHVTRWIMTHPDHLASDDAADLARLMDASPALAAAAGHVRSFADMMTPQPGPARTRGLAHRRRSRRPARTPLLRPRHPPRPARCHRRAGPAAQQRRPRRQELQDQVPQAAHVRPGELRPATEDSPAQLTDTTERNQSL
jgi:hypothetical protein